MGMCNIPFLWEIMEIDCQVVANAAEECVVGKWKIIARKVCQHEKRQENFKLKLSDV